MSSLTRGGSGLPPLKPPPRPHSPSGQRTQSQSSFRSDSSLSTTSNDSSQATGPSAGRSSPFPHQSPARPQTASGGPPPPQVLNVGQTGPRHQIRSSVDGQLRSSSPNMPGYQLRGHGRQHSQGFFEPSLPHATANSSGLSASQIAAQAAMQHISPPPSINNERKRSYPGLAPINTQQAASVRRLPSDVSSPQLQSAGGQPYGNGAVGVNKQAATTAANVVFPTGRSPLPSPGLPPVSQPQSSPRIAAPPPPVEKEAKAKSSKMKLFSKPKNITLSKEKDSKVAPSIPSPGKGSINASFMKTGFPNQSMTSLADGASTIGSIYSSANASTSTLVPVTTEKEKEKRHNFFAKQKNKLKDEQAPQLSLSSAHSNSQATNPEKPQPLYSFVPDSPGASTFAKSMSGFDLRHGGRALREKKKEEKAAAKMDLTPVATNVSTGGVSDQFGAPSVETLDKDQDPCSLRV